MQHCALVIGMCSHGLAVCRGLASNGVKVYSIESNFELPGTKTNCSEVIKVDSLEEKPLMAELSRLSTRWPSSRVILFPTNDKLVEILANNLAVLPECYEIAWKSSSEIVAKLQLKSSIESICEKKGINYPKSFILNNEKDIKDCSQRLNYPLILKPVKPLSGFKVILCKNETEVYEVVDRYQKDLPILAQEWIEGTDKDLFFVDTYYHNGNMIAYCQGNKLESFPVAMGQGTVAVTNFDHDIVELTELFFADLNLSGPAALEFKKSPDGKFWVIEPNMGRTEFLVKICIESGINIPYIQYHTCIFGKPPTFNRLQRKVIWFDCERDNFAFLKHFLKCLPLTSQYHKPCFPYLSLNDPHPFFIAFFRSIRRLSLKLIQTVFRIQK